MMTEPRKNVQICNHCQHENLMGALICAKCNRLIVSPGATNKTVRLSKEEAVAMTQQVMTTGAEASEYGRIQEIRLRVAGYHHVIIAPLNTGILMLGREDVTRAIYPDVDLTPFEASQNGISRCHAIIRREEDALYVQDLNSANGTFINERPTKPNHPHRLYHGDVLRLGKLQLEVAFMTLTSV
jgi:pSer/pThr/pTyr-binding forkhead associated (FHA) protein